jgi:hypothetical protein
MSVRWVQHVDGKVLRGDGVPPSGGSVHLIGETEDETANVKDGALYKDGKRAAKGAHSFKTRGGDDVTFDVDDKGKAKRRGGVKANGGNK